MSKDELPIGTIVFICTICDEMVTSHDVMITHMSTIHALADVRAALEYINTYVSEGIVSPTSTELSIHDKEDGLTEESEESDTKSCSNSKMWCNATVRDLITLYKEHEGEFEKKVKKVVWQKIAKLMNLKNNLGFTGVHCDTKWKGLVRTYKEHQIHQSTSGKGRRKWEFYDELNEFLFKKPEITAMATCSSHSGLLIKKQDEPVQYESLISNDQIDAENTGTLPSPKARGIYQSSFKQKRKASENQVEQRHQDKMIRLDKYLECFERLVDVVEKKNQRKDNLPDSGSND